MSTTPEQWLPEDLTGTLASNYIEEESHPVGECTTVGDVGRTIVISPYRGAFYSSNDLVVKYVTNTAETVLSRTDYRLIGMDVGRTRASSSQFGVYRFIQLTCDTSVMSTGNFVITYHAFGGEITRDTYGHILDLINAAAGVGSGGTTSSVDSVARNQIDVLGSTVAELALRLNMNAVASQTVKKSVTTIEWVPVAYSTSALDSYIDFSNPATLTGTGTFVIVSPNFHGSYTLSYEIIKNGSAYKCKLACDVQNQKITEFDSSNATYFTDGLSIPMFKMALTTSSLGSTGHRLVLLMALAADVTENYGLYIGDKTDVLLANNSSTIPGQIFDAWEVGNCTEPASPVESNVVLGLQDYYKIWTGNVNLALVEDLSWDGVSINKQYNTPNTLIPDRTTTGYTIWPFVLANIDVYSIKSMKVEIFDRKENKLITAVGSTTLSNPYGNTSDKFVYACMNYFVPDDCILELFYGQTAAARAIRLYALSGSSSYINKRFDLRSIYIK